MEEEWKTILDWPEYTISNFGEVYSIRRNRLLKRSLSSHGYFCVNLCHNYYWARCSIHRLVAFTFVDGYFEGAVVNHKDGLKTNNIVSNLEWVTHKDNMRHSYKTNLNPGRSKVLSIRIIETGEEFESMSACARHLNGQVASVSACIKGRIKHYRGYTFEYVEEDI